MKLPILVTMFVAVAGGLASAAELSVFRVCQDQRVIRTSDGAEAGRVEYIVVDPSDHQVVSTVISGGVVGDRLIAVPYTSLRFSGGREITLTEITRERLVSAPVIERTQISAAVIEPSIIQRTTTHFSARGDAGRDRTTVEGNATVNGRPDDPKARAEAERANGARPNAAATTNPNDPKANAEAATRQQAEARSRAEAEKNRANPNAAATPNQQPNATPNADAEAAKKKADAEAAQQQQKNAAENRKATKPNVDANAREKADTERNNNENSRPQSEAQPGRERKGAADRNASEETPKGRKPAEENATEPNSKRPPKKAPEPSAEERARENQRSPQL